MTDINVLADSVASGLATEAEKGTALKSIQTGVAISILGNLNAVAEDVRGLSKMAHTIRDRYFEVSEEDISSRTDTKELLDEYRALLGAQLSIIESQRKIVQGKSLFPEETLSDDEKMVVRLFKSFSTEQEKKKFMNLVKETMKEDTVQDFE